MGHDPDDPQITAEQGEILAGLYRQNEITQAAARARGFRPKGDDRVTPVYEEPWALPLKKDCLWYHTMELPNGETFQGAWTMPNFQEYVGGYDLNGKTVLDVGTATGYLAFNAEREGAIVTALDAASTKEFRHVPFAAARSYHDINASREDWHKNGLIPCRNSWWYSWHRHKSAAKCVYAPHIDLYEWDVKFDVVMAGAIIEHLSDPVFSIGAWARLAKEAVLIPFTDIAPGDDLALRPMTDWSNPQFNYAWWQLTRPLYERIFDNCGFDVEFRLGSAIDNADPHNPRTAQRPSIIATRRA